MIQLNGIWTVQVSYLLRRDQYKLLYLVIILGVEENGLDNIISSIGTESDDIVKRKPFRVIVCVVWLVNICSNY